MDEDGTYYRGTGIIMEEWQAATSVEDMQRLQAEFWQAWDKTIRKVTLDKGDVVVASRMPDAYLPEEWSND